MKVYLLILVKVAFATAAVIKLPNTSNFYGDHFNKTFSCFRPLLATGSFDGLPSLSPYIHNDSITVVTDNDYLRLNVVLDQVVVYGLADYRITRLDLEPDITMQVDVLFPRITIRSTYSGKANILGLYAVYGDGKLDFEFNELNASSVIKHSMLSPLISSVNTAIKAENIKITITELMDDVEFSQVFSIFSSIASTWFVNNFSKDISNYLNPIFETVVNDAIGKFNFLDYLAEVLIYSCND